MTIGDLTRHRVGKKDAELNPERLGEGEEGNPTQTKFLHQNGQAI